MAITGKELGQQRAFPSSRVEEQVSAKVAYQEGVTKREIFAALALQGYLAGRNVSPLIDTHQEQVADACVAYAEALCDALAKDGAP